MDCLIDDRLAMLPEVVEGPQAWLLDSWDLVEKSAALAVDVYSETTLEMLLVVVKSSCPAGARRRMLSVCPCALTMANHWPVLVNDGAVLVGDRILVEEL